MSPNEYDDPEMPHGDRDDGTDERFEEDYTAPYFPFPDTLCGQLLQQLYEATLTEFGVVLEELERTIHEINTTLGKDPASTGSRRSGVRDCDAVRLLRGNPRTACLLGRDRKARTAADPALGNDLRSRPQGEPYDPTNPEPGIEFLDHDRVPCDYCEGEGCPQCGGLGFCIEAHESISE